MLAAAREWITKGDRTWNARQIAAEANARYRPITFRKVKVDNHANEVLQAIQS